jgi:hypothetical protein
MMASGRSFVVDRVEVWSGGKWVSLADVSKAAVESGE